MTFSKTYYNIIFYCLLLCFLPFSVKASVKASINAKESRNDMNSGQYFYEIELNKDNCENIIKARCTYRNSLLDLKASFHSTKLVIFDRKAFAVQKYNNKLKFIKIKNSDHKIKINSENQLSLTIENGDILFLKNLNSIKAKSKASKCFVTKFLYRFLDIYGYSSNFYTKFNYYKDIYNFNSLKEIIIFSKKETPHQYHALIGARGNDYQSISNLHLCKNSSNNELLVKHTEPQDCIFRGLNSSECLQMKDCKDYIQVKDCQVEFFEGFEG